MIGLRQAREPKAPRGLGMYVKYCAAFSVEQMYLLRGGGHTTAELDRGRLDVF